MSEGNLAYYRRRARQEAKAVAGQSGAASAHRLLAIQYEDRVRELSNGRYDVNHTRPLETIDG